MNTIKLTMLMSAILGTMGTAAAADASAPRSRADVVAELDAARAAGSLGVMEGEDSGSFRLARQPYASVTTRTEVVARVPAARARGEFVSFSGEDSGSFWLSSQPVSNGLTRDEVMAEMFEARERGEITAMTGEDSGSVYLAQHAEPATLVAGSASTSLPSVPTLLMNAGNPAQACPAPGSTSAFAALAR